MRPLCTTTVVLLTFFLVRFGKNPIYQLIGINPNAPWTTWGFTLHVLIWYVLLPLVALLALHGFPKGWRELGWQANIVRGVGAAFLMTLPMVIGFAVFYTPVAIASGPTLLRLYREALLPGLAEETFYRAFLFGQLYRYGRWPFRLAALSQAILFGAAHLYQAQDASQALNVFIVTALGGVWFCWLWLAWRNLWVPIFVHVLMNTYWLLFSVSPTVFGGWKANLPRALVIVLSIALTLSELRKQGRTRKQIWRDTAPAHEV